MVKKIKVLQVIHGMDYGGAESVIKNIVTKINEDQFEVATCCVNFLGPVGEQLKNENHLVFTLESGLGVMQTLKAILKIINSYQPDIIHTHGIPAFLAIAPIFIFKKKSKWIHTYHFGNYPHIKKAYLYAQKILSHFASSLVAVSESQKAAVIKHLYVSRNKISTIFNGVTANPLIEDMETRSKYRKEFGFSDNDIVVACIVVLTEQKGVNYLLDAVDNVVSSNRDVKILIVGGGPLEKELKEHCSSLEYKEFVIFTGWRGDIKEIMIAADIFILPSLWEGLPMVLLEAMASRLPLVVTDVADNANVVIDGESGLVIPPKSNQAISDAILKLANDKEFSHYIAGNALSRYQQFYALDRMVSNYEKLYKKVTYS